jgi:hypothetical protein
MEMIHQSNLECLCNLKNNQYVIIKNNKLMIDDRYFSNWRYDNNHYTITKMMELYETSFMTYLEIISQSPKSSLIVKNSEKLTQLNIYEYNSSIIMLLEQSLNGLSRLANTYKSSNKNYHIILDTYTKLKDNLENAKINIQNYKKIIGLTTETEKESIKTNKIKRKINYVAIIWTNFYIFSSVYEMKLLLENDRL